VTVVDATSEAEQLTTRLLLQSVAGSEDTSSTACPTGTLGLPPCPGRVSLASMLIRGPETLTTGLA